MSFETADILLLPKSKILLLDTFGHSKEKFLHLLSKMKYL